MTDNGLVLAGRTTTTALDLPRDLSYDEWEETWKTLEDVGKALQWWTGDCLNFGEQAYGEKYTQAIELSTDDPEEAKRKYSTYSNWASIANKVPPENRDPDLSWSHHRAVAVLDPPEQKELLREAKTGGWSKAQLEREVKARRNGPEPELVETMPCPHCDGSGTVDVTPGGTG